MRNINRCEILSKHSPLSQKKSLTLFRQRKNKEGKKRTKDTKQTQTNQLEQNESKKKNRRRKKARTIEENNRKVQSFEKKTKEVIKILKIRGTEIKMAGKRARKNIEREN